MRSGIFVLCLIVSAPTVAQQRVLVRLLDGRTGKPITKVRVTITTYRDYQLSQVQAVETADEYAVDLNGERSIGLGNVSTSPSAWNEFAPCTSGNNLKPVLSVSDIISQGTVVPNECSKKIGTTRTKGEVVFFVRHLTIWERIRDYHLPS